MCECSVFPVIDLPGTGRNIQRLRQKAGVTVRELQAYFGFEYPQAIYKWQHGECLPSVDNLLALARVLRVPMEDLLAYDDQEVPHFWRTAVRMITDRFGRWLLLRQFKAARKMRRTKGWIARKRKEAMPKHRRLTMTKQPALWTSRFWQYLVAGVILSDRLTALSTRDAEQKQKTSV